MYKSEKRASEGSLAQLSVSFVTGAVYQFKSFPLHLCVETWWLFWRSRKRRPGQ